MSQSKRFTFFINTGLRIIAVLMLAAGVAVWRERSIATTPRLTQRIVSVDFHGIPLKDALFQLGASVGAKVVIHQKELEFEGVKLSTPIYLRLHDVELGIAFDRLNLGHPASCLLDQRGNELHVTTVQSLPSEVRIYDVHDIVDRLISRSLVSRSDGAQFADTFRTPVGPPTREELMDQLIRLIIDIADGEAQYFSNGTEMIHGVGSRIIVSGRPPVHRKIEELLRQLRESEI